MIETRTYVLNSRETRQAVARIVGNLERGMCVEIREPRRSDDQNAALHGLIAQIIKQRPVHNGIRMDMALWKAAFMQAMGEEVRFVPTLDGGGVFPIGLSTKALSKARFSELLEFVLCWAAKEGLTVEHFDDGKGASGANNLARDAA